jgi:hypothetical protein
LQPLFCKQLSFHKCCGFPLLSAFAPLHAQVCKFIGFSRFCLIHRNGCNGAGSKPSDCCSTRDQMGDKRNYGDHQQQVDETGGDVKCEETHGPKNQKHKSDYP